MKHLRLDWAGIQDVNQPRDDVPSSTIERDEPVFVMRASDQVSASVVRFWASCAMDAGADLELVRRVFRWADEMEAYAAAKRASGEWGPPPPPDAPELLP